jgi:YegS/Rv2252/BmrU family lipid kinase
MLEADIPWARSKRATIIVNPAAHNALKPKQKERIQAWLRDEMWSVDWFETRAAGDATRLAARAAAEGSPLVLVCGGDGTLNEAVNGLAGTHTAVGIIPAGTVNLWARELGVKRKNKLAALQQALAGEVRRVDLGLAGGRYFLCLASYGIDAAVTAGVSKRLKGVLGAAAYAVSSFREALRYRGDVYSLDMDGERMTLSVLMLVVSNTREYAGITQITPEAVVDDGLLDVRVFEGRGRRNIALHALRVLFHLHRKANKVHFRSVHRLKIEGEQPLPLQMDGDYIDKAVHEIVCVPGKLWVAVPAGFSRSLVSRPPESPARVGESASLDPE